MLDRAKAGRATPQQLFDYYLGWLANPAISPHFQLIPDREVGYARGWGMRDRDRGPAPRGRARRSGCGGKVVVGGHSLGGTITTAYATWDFGGARARADLAGLVYIDGGSSPPPISAADAGRSCVAAERLAVARLRRHRGAVRRAVPRRRRARRADRPDSPSLAQNFPLLPAYLKPPVPATNAASTATRWTPRPRPRAGGGAGPPRPVRHQRRPPGLGRGGRADADHALRARCSPAGA